MSGTQLSLEARVSCVMSFGLGPLSGSTCGSAAVSEGELRACVELARVSAGLRSSGDSPSSDCKRIQSLF